MSFWSTWLLLGATYILVLNPIRVYLVFNENWYAGIGKSEAAERLAALVGWGGVVVCTLLVTTISILIFPLVIYAHGYRAVTGKKLFEEQR